MIFFFCVIADAREKKDSQFNGSTGQKQFTYEKKKEQHNYKTGKWNVRTLNRGGKLENLKQEMQKNEISIPGVNELRWKGQGELRSGDYTVY